MTKEEFIESSDNLDVEPGKEEPSHAEEALGKDQEPVEIDNNKEGRESFTPSEQEAYDSGWRPEDEYSGKSPWKDAQTYLTIAKLNQKISALNDNDKKRSQEFDRRLEQQKKVYDLQIKTEMKALEKRFNSAVEEGDVDTANKHRTEMEDLNKRGGELDSSQPPVPDMDPDVGNWILKNPWINTDQSKGDIAKTLLIDIETKNPHSTTKEQLDILDKKLGSLYHTESAANPKRDNPTMNESGGTIGRSRSSNKSADMSTLRDDEKEAWRLLGDSVYSGNQKDFLKAVNKNRDEERGVRR